MVMRWDDVHHQYKSILEFIDWLQEKYDIRLDFDYCSNENPAPLEITKLVDEFLEVDQRLLEVGRRQLLQTACGQKAEGEHE